MCVIQQLIALAAPGVFGAIVSMEPEPEPELVQQDHHVQLLNQSHAAYGIAQQALISTVLDAAIASSLAT